jgi:putative transposase
MMGADMARPKARRATEILRIFTQFRDHGDLAGPLDLVRSFPVTPNYRRAFIPGGCWFSHQLAGAEKNAACRSCRTASRVGPQDAPQTSIRDQCFRRIAEPLHAIWTLPLGDADFSIRWRLIKTAVAKSLPKQERLSAARNARRQRGIWQRRF